jgi:fructose-1,6-bisphosphatase I
MIAALIRRLAGQRIVPPLAVPQDVAIVRGRWLTALSGRLAGMNAPAAAVTLGRTIVVHADAPLTPRLLRHELEHVKQWQAQPLTFPLRYLWRHLRHGYRDNPYEAAARAAEAEHGSTRWTEAAGTRFGSIPDAGGEMAKGVVTIGRHIIEREREFPEATGAFSNILYEIALAAKIISREVNKAGLVDILGDTDRINVHGEGVRKLDVYADEVIFKALDHGGHLCCMASEENETILEIPLRFPTGNYALLYDPLDGSSNIDVNVSVGTIFSIHRKVSDHPRGCLEDCLQAGRQQVAAGYIVYGSSTMLVYTTGHGVHGFTLDPSIGEFLLSHPFMKLPQPPQRIYSVNEGNYLRWSEGQQRLMNHMKGTDGSKQEPFSTRYVGSMVADFHRTLIYGGIFMYPADTRNPQGKLRLLYEAAPMAMIIECAGGRASTGDKDILDVEPATLHQRTPLYIGSTEFVDMAEKFLAQEAVVGV